MLANAAYNAVHEALKETRVCESCFKIQVRVPGGEREGT